MIKEKRGLSAEGSGDNDSLMGGCGGVWCLLVLPLLWFVGCAFVVLLPFFACFSTPKKTEEMEKENRKSQFIIFFAANIR